MIVNGKVQVISSSQLKKGDVFECEAGDVIPSDGEIIEGLASIDESAITGESAPVIREAGGDKSSVTGGTKVLSDRILVLDAKKGKVRQEFTVKEEKRNREWLYEHGALRREIYKEIMEGKVNV